MMLVACLTTYPNLDAIKHIETRNQPHLVGDGGKAYGVIQIHSIAVKEINRIYGTDFKHKDMFDVETSEKFFKLYMDACIKYYRRREGKEPSESDLVRMWNGGYMGYRRKINLKLLEEIQKSRYFFG